MSCSRSALQTVGSSLWQPRLESWLATGWELIVTHRIKQEKRKKSKAFLSLALIALGAIFVLLHSLVLKLQCPSESRPFVPWPRGGWHGRPAEHPLEWGLHAVNSSPMLESRLLIQSETRYLAKNWQQRANGQKRGTWMFGIGLKTWRSNLHRR